MVFTEFYIQINFLKKLHLPFLCDISTKQYKYEKVKY